jgi:hypothetical protein
VCIVPIKGQLYCYCHAGAKGERKYSSYSEVERGGGQHHAPAALYPGERTHGTHWIGDWVGLRAALDTEAQGKGHVNLHYSKKALTTHTCSWKL